MQRTQIIDRHDARPVEEAIAKAGDVTLCLNCAAVLQFAADMTLREIKLIEVDVSLRMKTAQVQAAIRTMGRPGPLNVWKM